MQIDGYQLLTSREPRSLPDERTADKSLPPTPGGAGMSAFAAHIFAGLLLGTLGCAIQHQEIEAGTYTPPATLHVQSICATNGDHRVVRIEMKNVSGEALWYS